MKDFNLYLKHTVNKGGGQSFEQPAFDPRRFVVEVKLEDPIIVFKSQILGGLKNLGDIDRFIEQNKSRVPPELISKVEAGLKAIEDQKRALIKDLS